MILADQTPTTYTSVAALQDCTDAFLRMARLYYDRYSGILDWSNTQGKTALHIAALKGNEELVRVCPSASYDLHFYQLHIRCCVTSEQILICLTTRGIHRFISESVKSFWLSAFAYGRKVQAHGVMCL